VRRLAAPLLVALAAAAPRLGVLLYERGAILSAFTEKSDDFAQTFVATGTYGFVPGIPSASTQPLYGWFLIPIYWLFGRSWLAVGLVQVAVAVAVALLVYELGRRFVSPGAGLVGALLATLQPYLVWHDVHINREILDQLLGAAIVLLTLLLARRASLRLAAALGVTVGLAILSNTRLVALPLVLLGYLGWRLGRRALLPAAVVLAATAVAVAPWVVRNRVDVGCWALTTDARALWKANNLHTYDTLARGLWIDDVPSIPGTPPTPEQAFAAWRAGHPLVKVDECAQLRYYQGLTTSFWRHHPGEKLRLAGQATAMLWNPSVRTGTGDAAGRGAARRLAEPIFISIVFALALAGLLFVPRAFAVLAVSLLAYETLAAAVFAGTTRYRVPWDFLLALLAGATVERVARIRRLG
jgi:4-amino-4-deoxy-L-arabinose transferase-like glycosyltransferase